MLPLLLSALFLLPLSAAAQGPAQPDPHRHEYIVQADRAVQAATAMDTKTICPAANTTVDINDCMNKRLTRVEAYYVSLVRALGGLLRLEDTPPAPKPQRLPFDDAESAWKNYRDKACAVIFSEADGGTGGPMNELGCRFEITLSHMHELRNIYTDYFL